MGKTECCFSAVSPSPCRRAIVMCSSSLENICLKCLISMGLSASDFKGSIITLPSYFRHGVSVSHLIQFIFYGLMGFYISRPNDSFYLMFRCLIARKHFNTIRLKQATSLSLPVVWPGSKWHSEQFTCLMSATLLACCPGERNSTFQIFRFLVGWGEGESSDKGCLCQIMLAFALA